MSNINSTTSVNLLTTSEFTDKEALVNYAMTFAHQHGYVLSIRRTKKNTAGIINYIDLKCNRGGRYDNRLGLNDENRKRKTTSKLIGCPFLLKGRRRVGLWHLEVSEGSHNHEPSPVSTKTLSGAIRLPCAHENPSRCLPQCDVKNRPELVMPPRTRPTLDEAIEVFRENFPNWSENMQDDALTAMMRKEWDSLSATPMVQDPIRRRGPERPVRSRNRGGNSDDKDPSVFVRVESEHVEIRRVESERIGRRCGLCHQMGHNMRTCSRDVVLVRK
ncbi:hypothetical protein BDF14DRAFT_1837808 [Spinellus fusiger]|nr:hypothetical protein BDF14DRAFT_1837808 [Spinellus fusiger]